jgi:hypothetical protein
VLATWPVDAVALGVPVVPVALEELELAGAACSSTNFASFALVAPVVPLVPVEPAGARWMHPVTVMGAAELALPVCGVVCAAIPTDSTTAAATHAPDRTIVLILPPLFQDRGRGLQP